MKPEDLPIANTTYMKAYEEYCEGRPDAAEKILDTIDASDQYYALALALRGRISTLHKDYKKALEWFEESLKVNDATSLTYYYKASVHEILKEHNEAIRSLSDCVDIDPDFALARTDLAGHYVAIGDYQTAIDHCNYCLQSIPAMEQALYWKAKALYELKRYAEAMKILEIYNDYADTFAVRLAALAGDVQLAMGDEAKAKDYYQKGYKENMDQFPDTSLVKLCKIHLNQGAVTEAMKLMRMRIIEEEALAAVNSECLDLLFKCYANVRYHNGDVKGAIQYYQRSLEVNKKQLDAWLELIRLLMETQQSQPCYDSILAALTVFPLENGLRKLKVALATELNYTEDALAELESLQNDEPALAASLMPLRCFALLQQGKTGECEQIYHTIKEYPFEPLGIYYLAKIAWARQDTDDAKRQLLKLLTPSTPLFFLSNAASMASVVMRDLVLASKICAFIVKHHPNHVLYVSQLARIRQMMGHYDFALTVWTHVTKLLPQDARAWVAIGDIYIQQDKLVEALTQFKQAQKCHGPEEDVSEAAAKEALTLLMLQRWRQGLDKLEEATSGPQYTDTALRVYGAVLSGQGADECGVHLPPEYVDVEHAVNLLKLAISNNVGLKMDEVSTLRILCKALLALDRKSEAEIYAERARVLVGDNT